MPKPPAYNKYQQWVDAGRPYYTGVSLANEVVGYAHLKKQLNLKESPYNRQKLDGFLYEHMRMVPAAPLKEEEKTAVVATEKAVATAPTKPVQTVKLKGGRSVVIDNAISKMGPEIPKPYSESKFELPAFHELPDVLKKARIENTDRRKRASQLHDQLAEGIADRDLRRDVCQEIVELMDTVMASYDAEREYKLHNVTPLQSEDLRAQFERKSAFELKVLLVDRLAPKVSYWKKQCNLRDGDALMEAKMRMAEAEHEKLMAQEIMHEKQRASEAAAAEERAKVGTKKKKRT